MLTFQDQVTLAQQLTGDTSAATKVLLKRDINEGGAMFLNRLGRDFNKEYLTGDIKGGQQYYQLPSEVLRISELQTKNGTNYYTPALVASEVEWNMMNTMPATGSFATHIFIKGFNEVGLYPTPSTDVADGIKISYEPQHVDLTQDDFTTGTVTISTGSTAVTHSANGFTQTMIGRWLQVTDGTDGKWYRIGAFISSSVVNLENYYEGVGGSGRAFRIGEVMKIPQAYQDAPVYYACERFYMTQNDQRTAPVFAQRFELKVQSAKETYSRPTSRMAIKTHAARRSKGRGWIDFTPPVSYP